MQTEELVFIYFSLARLLKNITLNVKLKADLGKKIKSDKLVPT
jgi:hypothetical protein